MNFSLRRQERRIFFKKAAVGKPPFGMPRFRPRITKIKIKAIHFARRERVRQFADITFDQAHIGKFRCRYLLSGVV